MRQHIPLLQNMEDQIPMSDAKHLRADQRRRPWACSNLTIVISAVATFLLSIMFSSFMTRQVDPKGCNMSYMRPIFERFPDFDARYTKFSQKYSLYLYREGVIDEDTRVKGVPVIFVPGNAGSYKQARSLAAEAAVHYQDFIRASNASRLGLKRSLDFFSIDFNEDFGAFHGQTLRDQAEYLNDAISYILALYHSSQRSIRDVALPSPKSVILIGHSMGGVVARAIFVLPNYQPETVNTIITLASPHALAPISFDAGIVKFYKLVNGYWRHEYSQSWPGISPLWGVSIVSIAGGGLDSTVPSEYSTLASIVPRTHGFAVYTSTIPMVWTSMDHLAITWCDQLRKVIIKALYEVVDTRSSSQTKPRELRMEIFKRHFLSGLESDAKDRKEAGESVAEEIDPNYAILKPPGERLILELDDNDQDQDLVTYLMPIPTKLAAETLKVITNYDIARTDLAPLKVMLCNVLSSSAGHSASSSFAENWARSKNETAHLACKDTHLDRVLLPASTSDSNQPFDHYVKHESGETAGSSPFSFLHYDKTTLSQFQIVAIFRRASSRRRAWIIAEFSPQSTAVPQRQALTPPYLFSDLKFNITDESLLSEIHLTALHSSLIAYKVRIMSSSSLLQGDIFQPILRQSIIEPFESKFFVNVIEADINIHGAAPYVPTVVPHGTLAPTLRLQIWSDPSNQRTIVFHLRVDILGSAGRLWMRYRSVLIISPLIVVALVFQRQLQIYDQSGSYISFSSGIDACLHSSIPKFLFAITLLKLGSERISLSPASLQSIHGPQSSDAFNDGDSVVKSNELFFGSNDSLSLFLIPFFGIIGVGVCVLLSFAVLAITHSLALCHGYLRKCLLSTPERSSGFYVHKSVHRSFSIQVTAVGGLLLLVATAVPYQLAFVVVFFLQITTCAHAQNTLWSNVDLVSTENFFNYSHSVAMLMLVILPVNIPILVVWIHNLPVLWRTPFPSHHDLLPILPFLIYSQVVNTGQTIPRMHSPLRHVTSGLFFFLAAYGAMFGATYGYIVHSIANFICFWLLSIHVSTGSFGRLVPEKSSHLGTAASGKNLLDKKTT